MNKSIIDRPTLDNLKATIGGDVEDLQELMLDFISDLPEQLECMRRALKSNDFTALRIAAHNTKSNCRDLGALELAELCTNIERHCKLKDSASLESQVSVVINKAQLVIQALQQINLHDD